MAEYQTARGTTAAPPAETKPPEEEKKEKPKPIDLEAAEVNELLEVVHNTKELPSLLALNQAAMLNLTIMANEVQEEMEKRAEEARKKAAEEGAKKAAEAKKAKEEEAKKEKAEREKADA
jgi:hypothetical protein